MLGCRVMLLRRGEHIRDVVLWVVWELICFVILTYVELDTASVQRRIAVIASNLFKIRLRTEQANIRGGHIIRKASDFEYLAVHIINFPLDQADAFDRVVVVPNTFDTRTW